MRQNDLLDWYEANLPVKERKLRGHFSTPPHLVQQILDACGYTPERELAQIRVLDPACGSGNFVSGAAQRLIAYGRRTGLSEAAIARLVRQNIWGFDPDPVACFLAEMQMHDAFTERPERAAESDQGDRNAKARRDIDIGQIQIHQADGLAFPWEPGGQVDLLLANPPYLAAKNTDLSVYRSAQQRGQADSYLLFLELALQIVRPGGWLGLVLPDPVLARSNAARERNRLLAETTIHHLWHLADVFAAYVGAVVIVAQKQPPTTKHHIAWRREHWQQGAGMEAIEATGERHIHEIHAAGSGNVSQKLLCLQEGAELRYLLSRSQGTLVERIYAQVMQATYTKRSSLGLVWLKELVQIRRGEEISKESPLLSSWPSMDKDETGKAWFPVLRGGSDIRPYGILSAQRWIARDKIVKPLERYLEPKLLVVKSAGQLQASLDTHGHVVLQTLYTLSMNADSTRAISPYVETANDGWESSSQHNRENFFSKEDELYYLLALLNSRLLQEYVYVLHTAYKWVQPQIEQRVLAQLPVPGKQVDAQEKEQIIQRAKQIMHACSNASSDVELKEQRQAWYEEQERAICRLYQAAIQERQPVKQELEQELSLEILDEGVIRYG